MLVGWRLAQFVEAPMQRVERQLVEGAQNARPVCAQVIRRAIGAFVIQVLNKARFKRMQF